MRFLWIVLTSAQLFAAASYASAGAAAAEALAVPVPAAAAASAAPQPSEQFPNYFKYLDYVVDSPLFTDPDTGEQSHMSSAHGHHLGEYAINKALASVLNRLEIPYVDETGAKQTKGFFRKLLSIAQVQDPEVKLYVFGGVVRSLLGYIYKKLHNANLRTQAELGRPLTDDELKHLTRRTFVIIIHGVSYEKYETYLSDRSDPDSAFNKDLPSFSVLGVGSDLDIVYSSTKKDFDKKPLEDFIAKARAEIKVQDRSEGEDFINSFLPKADVLNYEEQLKRTMSEGGSSLDWLAFPIDGNQLIIPRKYPGILRDFMHGIYRYLPPPSGTKASAKQTVRGLRPLLELPFLTLDERSQKQLESELNELGSVDQRDVDKLVRNARYGAANNRLTEGEIRLVALVKKSTSLKIPTFLKRTPIATRVVKNHSIDDLLMPRTEFEEKYTQNGLLLHGTKSLNNVLYMVRNGLFISQSDQGRSVGGPGFYTTRDLETAKDYAGNDGLILEFPLNNSDKLRIVDYANPEIKALQKPDESLEQFFFRLVRNYDIDIIVNTYVLVQNADAVRVPTKAIEFIQAIITDIEKLMQLDDLSFKDLQKIYNMFYTNTYKILLAFLAPGEMVKIDSLKPKFEKKDLLRRMIKEAEAFQIQEFHINSIHELYKLGQKLDNETVQILFDNVTEDNLVHPLTALNKFLLTMLRANEEYIIPYALKSLDYLDVSDANLKESAHDLFDVLRQKYCLPGVLEKFIQEVQPSNMNAGAIDAIREFYLKGHKIKPEALKLFFDKANEDSFHSLPHDKYNVLNDRLAAHTALNQFLLTLLKDNEEYIIPYTIKYFRFLSAQNGALQESTQDLFGALEGKMDLVREAIESFIQKTSPKDIHEFYINSIHELYKQGQKLDNEIFQILFNKVAEGNFVRPLIALNKFLLTMLKANEEYIIPYAIKSYAPGDKEKFSNSAYKKSTQDLFDALTKNPIVFDFLKWTLRQKQEVSQDHIIFLGEHFKNGRVLDDSDLRLLKDYVIKKSENIPLLFSFQTFLEVMHKPDEDINSALRKFYKDLSDSYKNY